MDSNETIIPIDETSGENGELSHSDKMIGVFTEPAKTFFLTSKFPPQEQKIGFFLFLFFSLLQL